METKKNNISAILCVFNEIGNISIIEKNIKNNQFSELIILDGGSSDGTFERLLTHKNIQLYKFKNTGLLERYLYGVKKSKKPMVFLFCADDDVTTLDFDKLKSEFYKLNADGIQIRPLSKDYGEYWSNSWSEYFKLICQTHKEVVCLGRPCLTLSKFFDGINVDRDIFCDDTYLKYEQDLLFGKLSYFASQQSIFREMPQGFKRNIKKFISYGRSDVVVVENNLSRFFNLLYHSLIRIAVLRSIKLILKGKFKSSFFTLTMGLFRGCSMLFYKIKK